MNFLANRWCNKAGKVVGLLSYKSSVYFLDVLGMMPCGLCSGQSLRLGPVFTNVKYFASACGPQKPVCGPSSPGQGCGGSMGGKNRVTYKPYIPHCYKDHDHKNMGLNRPMSPHLAIVKMTMPATMSIFQRITGVILASYAIALASGTLFLSNGVETYVSIIQSLNLGSTSVFIIKLLMGAPFAYHYFNGIRFCLWSAGRMLALKDVSSTATKAIVAAIAVTIGFAFL